MEISKEEYELLKNVCFEYISLRGYVRFVGLTDLFDGAFDSEEMAKIIKISEDSSHANEGFEALFELIKDIREDKEE